MIGPPTDRASLGAATALFRGLSDPARLAILWHLTDEDQRVVDITERLGLAQSTVSAHCACLRDCGLVEARAEGRATVYSLAPRAELLEFLGAAERLLEATGEAVALCPVYGEGAG